ncbi:alpha-L-fucosidase [Planctomycetota bacterium]
MCNNKLGIICLMCVLLEAVLGTTARAITDEFMAYEVDPNKSVKTAPIQAAERWKDDRFGLFIHWGPISQMGKQLSHSRNSPSHRPGGKPYKVAAIEPDVYDRQYKTFNPKAYDPDALVTLAKRAGMRYLVFTAKHHAGFSMFDSAVTDYDIMSAPFGRDLLKELEQACRRHDFNFGFYYSPRDWYHPDCDSEHHHDRYIGFYQAQMEELLENYGPIYEIWFDGLGPGDWGHTAVKVMRRIRSLHPEAMVNDRGGAGADFYTPEHTVSHFNRSQLWEACHTTTGQWGYNPAVHAKSLTQLMEILLYTWGADGNMLLNIGPRGDGSLNPEEVERLEQIAAWWAVHGEISIRGSRGGPYLPGPWGVATCKDNHIFLHIFRWPSTGIWTFPLVSGRTITKARLFNGGQVDVSANQDMLRVSVAPKYRDAIVTTVELQLNGDAVTVEPLPFQRSLTWDASLTASHDTEHIAHVTDRDTTTSWHARLSKGEDELWIEAVFKQPQAIGSVVTGRGDKWSPRHQPELQVPDGQGGWKTVFSWKPKWEPVKILKQSVVTKRIRLRVTGATQYHLAEFELYPPIQ